MPLFFLGKASLFLLLDTRHQVQRPFSSLPLLRFSSSGEQHFPPVPAKNRKNTGGQQQNIDVQSLDDREPDRWPVKPAQQPE